MKQVIDVHMHLAGTGCCDSGCWVSPSFKTRHTFRLLKILYRITDQQMATTIDADWATRIADLIRNSGVDRGVVLGFDGVYHRGHGDMDEGQSQMVIPPAWVFRRLPRAQRAIAWAFDQSVPQGRPRAAGLLHRERRRPDQMVAGRASDRSRGCPC